MTEKFGLRMHDGEESDTTLMKYYKYQSEEQDTLKQYGQFTGSREKSYLQ